MEFPSEHRPSLAFPAPAMVSPQLTLPLMPPSSPSRWYHQCKETRRLPRLTRCQETQHPSGFPSPLAVLLHHTAVKPTPIVYGHVEVPPQPMPSPWGVHMPPPAFAPLCQTPGLSSWLVSGNSWAASRAPAGQRDKMLTLDPPPTSLTLVPLEGLCAGTLESLPVSSRLLQSHGSLHWLVENPLSVSKPHDHPPRSFQVSGHQKPRWE